MNYGESMRRAMREVVANLAAMDDGVIELPAGTPLHILGEDGCKYALADEGGDYEYLCEMANKWKRDTQSCVRKSGKRRYNI